MEGNKFMERRKGRGNLSLLQHSELTTSQLLLLLFGEKNKPQMGKPQYLGFLLHSGK